MHALPPALLWLFGLADVLCFNIETENPNVFSQQEGSHFGYSMSQLDTGTEKWLIVGAPLTKQGNNTPGAIYKCRYRQDCKQINIPAPKGQEAMGLSLAVQNKESPALLACSPRQTIECGTNTFVKGQCYAFNQELQQNKKLPSKGPECPKRPVDIAFLIDGSGSVTASDFQNMKLFIKELMKKFSAKNAQFAVIQYSRRTEPEFSFKVYRNVQNKQALVDQINQLQSSTYTFTALKYVADNTFEMINGGRTGATRILITITDGLSHDKETSSTAIQAADRKNIKRYAVGVGRAFKQSNALDELRTIASQPADNHMFAVGDFSALDGIQDDLENRIFAIEGTQGAGDQSSFEQEMSQEGFSALLKADTVLLGSVGSYDWSGEVSVYSGDTHTFLNLLSRKSKMKNAYLGYSIKEIKRYGDSLYAVGAPRYEHKGNVFIFSLTKRNNPENEISGIQIGSYFGSELCAVDLNSDGRTDLLLIGAPLYFNQNTGGIVHIHQAAQLNNELGQLRGERGLEFGRFGSSIAAIRDVNGDGITDVAVGAPLENGGSGCVYIFHGRNSNINPAYAQRIEGGSIDAKLRYFGRSIDGSMDMTKDGLTDISVGALDRVFILRSRPVLQMKVTVTFTPDKIKQTDVDCQLSNGPGRKVNAKVCFTITKETKDNLGELSVHVSYQLALDKGRKIQRAELVGQRHGSLTVKHLTCLETQINVKTCIQDSLNPITLHVDASVTGQKIREQQDLVPMLKEGENITRDGKLLFKQECGADNICRDQLVVTFDFQGARSLVVSPSSVLLVNATLENQGENSLSTDLYFFIPAGLSFRKTDVIQSSRPITINCDASKNSDITMEGKIICNINHPIFTATSRGTFLTTFDVLSQKDWKESVTIKLEATSSTEKRDTNYSSVSHSLPVQYEINVILKELESTQYINGTSNAEVQKPIEHIYKVENIGQVSLPVNLTFEIPVAMKPDFTWEQINISSNLLTKIKCTESIDKTKVKNNSSITAWYVAVCELPNLEIAQAVIFRINGVVKTKGIEKSKHLLMSNARVTYDTKRFIHTSQTTTLFQQATVTTQIDILTKFNALPIIVGSSVGGLVLLAIVAAILYKVGFFKREYKDLMNEGDGAADANPDATPAAEPTPSP